MIVEYLEMAKGWAECQASWGQGLGKLPRGDFTKPVYRAYIN